MPPEPSPKRITSSLDDMLAEVPSVQQEGAVLYDLQEALRTGGMSLYDMTSPSTYAGLKAIEQATARGERLTDNQYSLLNRFEEALGQKKDDPYYAQDDPRKTYAGRTSDVVESIKHNLGLRIGDQYVRGEDDGKWY